MWAGFEPILVPVVWRGEGWKPATNHACQRVVKTPADDLQAVPPRDPNARDWGRGDSRRDTP